MSEHRENSSDYHKLFVEGLPLMDVRAPVEFDQGAFPTSVNIPLLDDLQREQIGIRYKEAGQQEAIQLGLELVKGETKQQRLTDWADFCRKHPDGYLYCFRGGLRSRTTQQWLKDNGIEYPLIEGGYKAMRRFLIEQLDHLAGSLPMVVISGLTGTGKTQLLNAVPRFLDLEGRANHRGSAFGMDVNDFQPTPINFENALAVDLLRLEHSGSNHAIFVEDEGKRIGRLSVPAKLYEAMHEAPRIVLTAPLDSRVQHVVADYVYGNWADYQAKHGDQAEQRFSEYFLGNLGRIRKRLGGERYQAVERHFQSGLQSLFNMGDAGEFSSGIQILLEDYYDPMYHYQLKTRNPTILAEGDQQTLLDWARSYRG